MNDQSRLVPRASAVEALTQIRALCDEAEVPSHDWHGPAYVRVSEVRAVLDAVPVDATPPQGIDRESARERVRARINRIPDSDSVVVEKDVLLALVRPVEGVVLTPEEAATAAACVRAASRVAYMRDDLAALASRLEASS